MGHYLSEMCCQKCMHIPCKCPPSKKLLKAIAKQKRKDEELRNRIIDSFKNKKGVF